jgi:heme-degrading monooxygenase HmoA
MSEMVLVTFAVPTAHEKTLAKVLNEHRQAVGTWPGFLRLCWLRPREEKDVHPTHGGEMVGLLLEFEQAEQLARWRESEAHQKLSAAYRELWCVEPVVKFFEVQEA